MAVASPDKDFFQVTCLDLPDSCWLPFNLSASCTTVCVGVCPAVCVLVHNTAHLLHSAAAVPGILLRPPNRLIQQLSVRPSLTVCLPCPIQLLRPGIILLRPPKKPAPGERVNKYALVPYSTADFEQVSVL